ncbi:hypothetical protein PIB30_016966 [Stylosanthes scabra]|uniref:Leucine-rich repeat-containing N-terminal plant-type domain-containing protein n=1 Tax=Stylosanthes scabra TaxID=79078 RepID=A0ABU6Y6I5_9FABA|nr:hypothetical protein [Stylosanthes scabra]
MLKRNGSVLGCLEAERVALFRLRDAFNHPNDGSSLLPSWQGLGDCCTWERVICDNSTKRVTYLLLNYTRPYVLSNLQWSLNASHFLPFHELQGLDLSGNYLSALLGSLKLNNLQKLSFRNNMLTKVPSFGRL